LKKETLKIVLIGLFILSGYILIAAFWDALEPVRGEDRLIENLGAFFFLTASVLFFLCYRLSSRSDKDTPRTKKNKFYLFLAIIFFIGCGEEISWGQRIFKWPSPVFVQEMNTQRETNLHNFNLFNDSRYRRGKALENERRPILSIMLDVDTWFFLFWFSYCLILPLANRYSLRANRVVLRWGLPVPPLWIGCLLFFNFLMYVIPHLLSIPRWIDHDFNELRESHEAFLFAVLAHHELKKQISLKKGVNSEEEEMQENGTQ
jgi:hypothetical protein